MCSKLSVFNRHEVDSVGDRIHVVIDLFGNDFAMF